MIYNNYKWPSVNIVVDGTLGLILKRSDTFLHQKQISVTKIYTAKTIVLEANECVQGLNNYKYQITGGTSQRGFSRANTAINTNYGELKRINTAIFVAKEYLKEAKDSNKEFKKSFDEAATHFERFYIYFPHQTRESLMGHAKAILQLARDYYKTCSIKTVNIAMT